MDWGGKAHCFDYRMTVHFIHIHLRIYNFFQFFFAYAINCQLGINITIQPPRGALTSLEVARGRGFQMPLKF